MIESSSDRDSDDIGARRRDARDARTNSSRKLIDPTRERRTQDEQGVGRDKRIGR